MTEDSASPKTKRLVFGGVCLIVFLAGLADLIFAQPGPQGSSALSSITPFAIVIAALGLAAAASRPEFFIPVEKKLDWADIPVTIPPPATEAAPFAPATGQTTPAESFDLHEFIRK
jgi:hypothetical protein